MGKWKEVFLLRGVFKSRWSLNKNGHKEGENLRCYQKERLKRKIYVEGSKTTKEDLRV